MSAAGNDDRAAWLPRLRVVLCAGLVLAAIVLANRLVEQLHEEPTDVLDAGSRHELSVQPFGLERTIKLPSLDVMVHVGAPVRTLDEELVDHGTAASGRDLRAPDGGSLVPISWSFANANGNGFVDPEPITLRLADKDESVELESVTANRTEPSTLVTARNFVVAFEKELDNDDLRLEVEYDGLTQVLDVGSGDIDAGRAQPLYEAERFLLTGCEIPQDNCDWDPVGDRRGLRPLLGSLIVEPVPLSAWDRKLGWADDGTLWATVPVRAYAPDARTDSGATLLARELSALEVTLNGEHAERQEGSRSGSGSPNGNVVFVVPADQASGRLEVRTVLTLENDQKLSLVSRARLRPA
ncbi:hypothetical protein ASG90_16275 [Nocardioides sp. Soil797]|nr:hypothetical protein ASG90_16275 [Nocardioides sp. Soil797]